MPAFSAINLEPEENVDDEIDTTRELNVDEALKHFQTALKLHAQGPQFFDEASDAYNALFECEIFKYPESKTEYERTETGLDEPLALGSSFAPVLDLAGSDGDGSGSSLPQALYLAYKNYGRFLLDRIRHRARTSQADGLSVFDDPAVLDEARNALESFTAALDRDPSDAELWRKTARVAAFLKSARVSRYSLEAALELDDDPAVVDVEPPSLAEAFAGEQLKNQLKVLSDDMALTHPIMKPFLTRKLPTAFERYLDPAPFLPDPTTSVSIPKPASHETRRARLVVKVSSWSWGELGIALVQSLAEHGPSGDALYLELPDTSDQGQDEQMEIDKQLQAVDEAAEPGGGTDERSAGSPEKRTEVVAPPSESKSVAVEEPPVPKNAPRKERSTSLPSRKRSQSAAGLTEVAEDENGETKRSKRTRRRDTAAEEATDPTTLLATQLEPFQDADRSLFKMTRSILESTCEADQVTLGMIAEMMEICASEERTAKLTRPAAVDLRGSILSFEEENAKILLSKKENPSLGLTAFLEHTKSGSQRAIEMPTFDEARGVKDFVGQVNAGWHTIQDAAYEWVKAVTPTYTLFKWSDRMKTAVVQVISRLDDAVYDRVSYEVRCDQMAANESGTADEVVLMAQMLFELHLDVYQHITNPNSVVDYAVRIETKARLGRWMHMAAEAIRRQSHDPPEGDTTSRFLWAAIFSTTLSDGVARDHTLACWNSLRDDLAATGREDISLPNNAVMPEISAAAAEREISKLITMDFFMGLFQEDMSDPVSIVGALEPVLNPDSVYVDGTGSTDSTDSIESPDDDSADRTRRKQAEVPIKDCASQSLRDLWKFLEGSNTDLRLSLWAKLGEAYKKMDYTTKQFSCYLRSIEMVLADFDSDSYLNTSPDSRRKLFMTMLKSLDELVIQALDLALNDNRAFDVIDEPHFKSTASALARLNCLLHVAALLDDETRIGMRQPSANSSTFTSFLSRLQDMQVRTWCLQYTVLKMFFIAENAYDDPERRVDDTHFWARNFKTSYLSHLHRVLGLRKSCKAINKVFLKMMRGEILKRTDVKYWGDDLEQVLYDLHGLKLGLEGVEDHGCPPEKLEKRQAMMLVEKVTVLANDMSMKDLLKSDLKNTIDHMQQAIGSTKSTPQMIHNLRNFTEYLKKPIHPLRLYQALTGNVTLDAVTVNTPESALAKHGWFFLLGMFALTKFKGVDLNRRQTPGATDDLRIGATFLRLQLQFTPERWDAWFRLAECFDYELDEAVLWTADKMNKERAELVKFQRNAIHCYTLALSHSHSWDPDPSARGTTADGQEALYELYHKFGMRLYASSREPFAMEPFLHADQERFFIENDGSGAKQRVLHEEMTDYKVWKYAAGLFRRAMVGKPKDWKNPYMFAKCLWKMFQKPPESLDGKDRISQPTVEAVVRALEKTVEVVSSLPKPRHGQDPILEPHYKILSVVYKLVKRGKLTAQEGADILQRQPYAVDPGAGVTIESAESLADYVIRNLRHLRDKDKSNWQHRLVIRHASIILDSDDSDHAIAPDAFDVLREGMFTKTMVMNVWKCDAERPGRHHVYTERYVRLMVTLLVAMGDRANMEALLRRLRKKGADFYHFNDLWQSCVTAYLTILRKFHNLELLVIEDDIFKNLSQEEFDAGAEEVNEWAFSSEDAENDEALSAMKDAIDVKKLNGNLMKAAPIDDLICDCYSSLYKRYSSVYRQLKARISGPGPEPRKDNDGLDKGQSGDVQEANGNAGPPETTKEPTVLGSLRAPSEQPEKMEKQLSSTGDAAPKARRAGIRKADILRKADQAVQRMAEGVSQRIALANRLIHKHRQGATPNNGENDTPDTEAEDDMESDGGHDIADTGDGDADDVEMKDADEGDQEAGEYGNGKLGHEEAGSDISSVPGSVHDSADDESDLSDVPADYYDDALAPALLFPNLRRSVDAGLVSAQDTEAESSAVEASSPVEEPRSPPGEGAGGA